MTEQIKYKRVTCGIFLNPEEYGYDSATGQTVFHPEWLNRWKDWQSWFEDEFEAKIVSKFGESGWAVRFIQVTQHEPNFFIDCYIDSIKTAITYDVFVNFVGNLLTCKQIRYTPFLRGTVDDYIQNR